MDFRSLSDPTTLFLTEKYGKSGRFPRIHLAVTQEVRGEKNALADQFETGSPWHVDEKWDVNGEGEFLRGTR